MRNKKELHAASCIDELNNRTKLPEKIKLLNVLKLNRQAEVLYNEAMKSNSENDEEIVYIYLMKYCEILQIMKSTFAEDFKYISRMNSEKLKKAVQLLTYIKKSLESRYEEKIIQDNNKSQYSMQNKICTNEDNLNFEFESTITNNNLYTLLKYTDRKKICLLDTRPSEVFHKYKITSCDVINIPKENLIPGITADTLKNKLEEPFKEKWIMRHTYDYIVILDQGTEDIEDDQKLINLRNALLKWDPTHDYSKKLKFLKGGYEDFNHLCPWETTQYTQKTESNKEVEPLLEDEFDPEPEPEPEPEPNYEIKNIQVKYPSLELLNDLDKFRLNSDNLSDMKSNLDHIDNNDSSEEELTNQRFDQIIIERPQFDRSIKPLAKLHQFTEAEMIKPNTNDDELDDENNELQNNIEELKNRRLSLENISENDYSYIHKYKNQESNSNLIPHVDRSTKPLDDLVYISRTKINEGDGLRGLLNLGNTCYMNTILQCLSTTEDLVKYFINIYNYNKFTNYKSRTKGLVAKEFSVVIKSLWSQSGRGVQCQVFKDTIGEYKDMFKQYDQQDSHEFLTILLDWLHDDLNQPEDNRIILGASKETGEEDWGHWTKANNSIIQQLFYGQQKSTVSCNTCSEKSVTFEPFSSLSLPLPSQGYKYTLSDCLQLYLNGESICGWHCPRCKRSRDATKKLDIMRLPPYLIIHLKRFSSDGSKKNSNVEFPKVDLDMSNYINGEEHRNRKYYLYGVSNHSGSLDGGHYTASCLKKSTDKWYKFDDVRVYEIESSMICSPEAYILFYCRKN